MGAGNLNHYGRRESDPVIRMLQAVNVCYARIYHRVQVTSPCKLPLKGPAILVCNHTSALDPVLIQSVCPRLIRWMMAAEYFETPGLNTFFKTVGTIQVERSGRDGSSTRQALRALADGYILGIFPEGMIETTPELLPFRNGVARMALKTGVPVFPAYLDGTQRGKEMVEAFVWRNSATLAFGPQVRFAPGTDARTDLDAATAQVRNAVAALRAAALERPARG